MIICDTSALLAAYSAQDARTGTVIQLLTKEAGALIMSPFVLAELDYMIATRSGIASELKLLSDVADGVYRLADFNRADVAEAADVTRRYQDMLIGLADASIVVLAARYDTTRLLTFDERHFRAIKPLHADAFTILPADG